MICTCGRPTTGTTLCDRCANTLGYALANLAVYTRDLDDCRDLHHLHSGAPATEWQGRPLGGTATMPIAQLRWDTLHTLHGWARVIMEERPQVVGPLCGEPCFHVTCHAITRTAWPADTVPGMLNYLAGAYRWATSREWAPDMLDELINLEERHRRAADIPAPRWYAGKCDQSDGYGTCGAELYATTDTGSITCPGCGTGYDIGARRDQLLDQAQDHHVDTDTAIAALTAWTDYDGPPVKLRSLIERWRDTNRLEVADVTALHGRDRHLYRLGDVQALLHVHMRRARHSA